MSDGNQSFERFMEQREAAAGAYVSGDAGPLGALSTRALNATFFGPGGGAVQGADEVSARYAKDAGHFAPGSESRFEILDMGASGEVGYWVGWQRAKVNVKGKDEPVPMSLRVTEVFRREGDAWKLVHRHADMLAEEQKGPKK